tara:strand:+ start:11068 stop:13962 length:2895 start_codon:yes stop_codon:yes gene_type:complete
MNDYKLRNNQNKAICTSVQNDFTSGVHFHATGTGKSWIALELIIKYNHYYPKNNVLWLCEQKSILIEQFNKKTLKEKGYNDIHKIFLIIDYTENKSSDWYDKVNSATFWKKPILLIINRQFLVSQQKYKKLKLDINLIIHDECHSIQNKTTKEFYEYIMMKNEDVKCLGFSATPYLEYIPYKNIISEYTIYDAFCDDVIVAPKIKWVESKENLTNTDLLNICKNNISKLHYKKIIVWCGIIEYCNELSNLWKEHFSDFTIYVDTSLESSEFSKYAETETNSILFCACKHREGSDIKNLDCCIFLDKVENRNAKTFIQCIGRVLRKDKLLKKKYGLILDLKAHSCIKICDRMNEYLNCNNGFPWKYKYKEKKENNKKFIEHELILKKPELLLNNEITTIHSICDIINKFVRKCPDEQKYKDRLQYELKMIESKNLASYLIRAVDILELTNYIPHVTRGSCGSSLVCYLLGISNVDPINHEISFARFLNTYRDNLPDIDFDFPHYLRDEVFLKLELEWPNQVARISNHVHWHEKSALREALRKIGINRQIPKEELYEFIENLQEEDKQKVYEYQQEIDNTFRHYSLHCGGIVFFHDGVPNELRLNKKTLSQIVYDKNDVSKTNNFKIDILSSRGISQLINIVGKNIDFNDCPYDQKTYELLWSGNNIGITLAESPLMRKALMTIKPKSISDLAICLAIIRPAAKDTRTSINDIDYNTKFIFDDDAITLLSQYLHIDEDLADKYRRSIAKNKWNKEDKIMFDEMMNKLGSKDKEYLENQLKNLKLYSFCKSHSYSYAQLVYKLAYQKAHNIKSFWFSTIKNVKSSYRKWVHLYEACRNGVDVYSYIHKKENGSIYAKKRNKKFAELSLEEQIKNYGYWNMQKGIFFPNCYFYLKNDEFYFGGLIASSRVIGSKPKTIVCYIGVGPGKYIEVITRGKYMNAKHYGLKGRATIKNEIEQTYIAHIAKYY